MNFIDISRLEEARQARVIATLADEHFAVGGGIASRGAAGTHANSTAGMGLNGPVELADVQRIVDWYVKHGIEPRIEVSPFADETLVQACGKLGFVVRMFEMVLYRELNAREPVIPIHPVGRDVVMREVDRGDARQVRTASETIVEGFLPGRVRPEDLEICERNMRKPEVLTLAAYVRQSSGEVCAGAGQIGVSDGIATPYGASVRPEHRRQGIQQALLAERLNSAMKRGATLATIGSLPGTATERNVRRMGFALAYTKVVLVRPGEGLAPVLM